MLQSRGLFLAAEQPLIIKGFAIYGRFQIDFLISCGMILICQKTVFDGGCNLS